MANSSTNAATCAWYGQRGEQSVRGEYAESGRKYRGKCAESAHGGMCMYVRAVTCAVAPYYTRGHAFRGHAFAAR
eukprot:6191272-Pleurochrysis_carterae.AAC.1